MRTIYYGKILKYHLNNININMPWYNTFDDVFWITISGMAFGFFGAVLTSLFKSKCKKCKLCCLEVERDIQAEIQEEKMELEFKNNDEEHNKERNENLV